MINFLSNHAVSIVAILTVVALLTLKVRSYMNRKALDRAQLVSILRQRAEDVTEFLLIKIGVAVVLTLVISVISFREFWINDVFHIVFLTSILLSRTELYLNRITQ